MKELSEDIAHVIALQHGILALPLTCSREGVVKVKVEELASGVSLRSLAQQHDDWLHTSLYQRSASVLPAQRIKCIAAR